MTESAMNEGTLSLQLFWMVVVAVAATLPVLAAFLIWKRQAEFQFQIHSDLRKQMQEQIDSQQKTIRFLVGRVDELELARAREYAETEILRQETDSLRQEVGELRQGVAALTRQIEAADMTPAWSPPVKPQAQGEMSGKTKAGGGIDSQALQQFITEYFNVEDMEDLTLRLDVDFENLAGETKEAKTRSLVNYMRRHRRLAELRDMVRALRPEGEI
jgi:hypothetical protein